MEVWKRFCDQFWKFFKYIVHLITKKSEIERICESGPGVDVTIAVLKSFEKSNQLVTVTKPILLQQPFNVNDVKSQISFRKFISSSQALYGLELSLLDLNCMNRVYAYLDKVRLMQFDSRRCDDINLLNSFWSEMMPNMRRTSTEVICDDWCLLGFQNKNPISDLRGMGLLGLIQLQYLSSHHRAKAQEILSECNHSLRYLPFAATGINFTALTLELLRKSIFHKIILTAMHERYGGRLDLDTLDGSAVDYACGLIHDLYCSLYFNFIMFWKSRNPSSIMKFQELLSEFRTDTISKYSTVSYEVA